MEQLEVHRGRARNFDLRDLGKPEPREPPREEGTEEMVEQLTRNLFGLSAKGGLLTAEEQHARFLEGFLASMSGKRSGPSEFRRPA